MHPEILSIKSFAASDRRPIPRSSGRGIVTSLSDRYLPFFLNLLDSLKDVGCSLPIEVWHSKSELSDKTKEILAGRVTLRRFQDIDPYISFIRGFATKPFAILHSNFRECLFLDADNYVIRNPEVFFNSTPYLQTGALFWEDMDNQASERGHFSDLRLALGLPAAYRQCESGQMVINRVRHWKSLVVANEINQRATHFYKFMWGDAQSYQLAMELVNEPFSYVPKRGVFDLKIPCMVQHNLDGSEQFLHITTAEDKFKVIDGLSERLRLRAIQSRNS